MPEFLIREATDEDGPVLTRLAASIKAEAGDALPPPDPVAMERPASHFAASGGKLWLVLRDAAAAGSFGIVRHEDRGEFELTMICLEKDARGQGLAAALLAGANAFAAVSEAKRLSVWADVEGLSLHRFCERHGFLREPGVRARRDGSGRLEACFARAVA